MDIRLNILGQEESTQQDNISSAMLNDLAPSASHCDGSNSITGTGT